MAEREGRRRAAPSGWDVVRDVLVGGAVIAFGVALFAGDVTISQNFFSGTLWVILGGLLLLGGLWRYWRDVWRRRSDE